MEIEGVVMGVVMPFWGVVMAISELASSSSILIGNPPSLLHIILHGVLEQLYVKGFSEQLRELSRRVS